MSDSCTAKRVLRLLPLAIRAVSLIDSEDADLREHSQSLVLAICRRGAAPHVVRAVGEEEVEQYLSHAASLAQAELDAIPADEDRVLHEGYVQLVQELKVALIESPPTAPVAPDMENSDSQPPVLTIQNPSPNAASPAP